jgi:uncharacterized membrane protein (Fun14 family)
MGNMTELELYAVVVGLVAIGTAIGFIVGYNLKAWVMEL